MPFPSSVVFETPSYLSLVSSSKLTTGESASKGKPPFPTYNFGLEAMAWLTLGDCAGTVGCTKASTNPLIQDPGARVERRHLPGSTLPIYVCACPTFSQSSTLSPSIRIYLPLPRQHAGLGLWSSRYFIQASVPLSSAISSQSTGISTHWRLEPGPLSHPRGVGQTAVT
jgi:hypothetical protein